MARKSLPKDEKRGRLIRERREQMGLTIEAAAGKADVGIKTWSRWESGEPVAEDKISRICFAMKWAHMPAEKDDVSGNVESLMPNLEDLRMNSGIWPGVIEKKYGEYQAYAFCTGCSALEWDLSLTICDLGARPRGTHIGELSDCFVGEHLPEQFLMEYDYEFIFALFCALNSLEKKAELDRPDGFPLNGVADEIVLYLIKCEAEASLSADAEPAAGWDSWYTGLMHGSKLDECLYSHKYVAPDNEYHFSHWLDKYNRV